MYSRYTVHPIQQRRLIVIKFNANNLKIEIVRMKHCSTMLGGTLVVIDEKRSKGGKEKYKRISIPLSLAQKFSKVYKVIKYVTPIKAEIIWYKDVVVSIERQPAHYDENSSFDGKKTSWSGQGCFNIETNLKPMIGDDTWYIDGLNVYRFVYGVHKQVKYAKHLSLDGKFRVIPAECIRLSNLDAKISSKNKLEIHRGYCVGFVIDNNTYGISPPVWKSELSVRKAKEEEHTFDVIDERLHVSLAFGLKAGKNVSESMGYDAIECLNLPDTMISLNTINLSNLPKEVKNTYPIDMTFTHTVAWLLGLLKRKMGLKEYMAIRGLLKHLFTTGTYHVDSVSNNGIYKDGQSGNLVVKVAKDQALKNAIDKIQNRDYGDLDYTDFIPSRDKKINRRTVD